MKIDKSVQITGLVVVAVLLVALIISNAISGVTPGETITVEGVSEVFVVPDRLSVYLNVESLKDSAEEAKSENARIMADVRAALIAEGFSSDDFETQNFNVYEEFDWSRDDGRESLGFKATHSIVVHIDSQDEVMIGRAIDAGVDNGALLGYIDFALSQELENEYKAKALKLAAEDARTKGEAVAEGLGARLGDVVSTSMGNGFRYYPMAAFAEDAGFGGAVKGSEVATNIQVGEQKINSQISVTYKLK